MAAVTKGPVYVYGVDGTIAGAISDTAWQSFKRKQSFAIEVTVENNLGQRVHKRFDDQTKEGTVEFIPKSIATIPALGDNLNIDGVVYWVKDIDEGQQNKAFVVFTLTLEKTEYITETVGGGG